MDKVQLNLCYIIFLLIAFAMAPSLRSQESNASLETDNNEIERMQKKLDALESEIEQLKKRMAQEQQQQSEQDAAPDYAISINPDLDYSTPFQTLGRFQLQYGFSTATIVFDNNGQNIERNKRIPIIKACTDMADLNRMSAQDFLFLGFDQSTSNAIISERQSRAGFSSSRELLDISGVKENHFWQIRPSIIAIGVNGSN